MPDLQWNAFSQALDGFKASVGAYAGAYNFSYEVQSTGSSVDFIYTFSEGWDYDFYSMWRNEVVDVLNASTPPEAGYRWDVSVDGQVSSASNPWKNVSWINAAIEAYADGSANLITDTHGWLWTSEWSTQGSFWGYSWSYGNLGWVWVYGGGIYYSYGADSWYYILPGWNVAWLYGQNDWFQLGDI